MQIKFRGKRIDTGEWIYGSYLDFAGYCEIMEHDEISYPRHEVLKESVGQLWKPSLNLIVYTGDLLTAICSPSGSISKKERLCKVCFDSDGFSISIWHKKEWWGYASMDFTSIKVIGNITDNPDLLGL